MQGVRPGAESGGGRRRRSLPRAATARTPHEACQRVATPCRSRTRSWSLTCPRVGQGSTLRHRGGGGASTAPLPPHCLLQPLLQGCLHVSVGSRQGSLAAWQSRHPRHGLVLRPQHLLAVRGVHGGTQGLLHVLRVGHGASQLRVGVQHATGLGVSSQQALHHGCHGGLPWGGGVAALAVRRTLAHLPHHGGEGIRCRGASWGWCRCGSGGGGRRRSRRRAWCPALHQVDGVALFHACAWRGGVGVVG